MAAREKLKNLSEEYCHIFIDSVDLLDKDKENANLKELNERTYRVQTILYDLLVVYFHMKNNKKFVSLFCVGEEAIQELYGDNSRRENIKAQDFIEVTALDTSHKMLVRVSEIKCVDELESGAAKITTDIKDNLARVYIDTKDSYIEVIDKIRQTSN